MLATVIADKATPLPMSVGIFGEWGSGKSYFMGLLREQVEELAGTDNPAYCRRIEQIGFNAWHYADSNLWASLGDEIFRQLAESGGDTAEQRETLRIALAVRLTERRRLEAVTEQAQIEVATLQASVETAAANREAGATELITAMRESDETRNVVNGLWRRLGVNDEIEQGKLFVEQFRGTLTEANALRRAPWNRRGKIALATAAVLVVSSGFAALLASVATEWLVGIGGVVTALAGGGITALTVVRSGLRKLRELSENLHKRTERAAKEAAPPDEVVEKLEALRRVEAEQRIAEAQLSEVISQVGELGRQLAELAPGRRLYSFLADRARSDSYSRNLGLISMIRKDFQQLIDLMNDWRENGGPVDDDTRQPVERIVLYIDDLDRCSPRQVVDVLQAVHLLLAMELFVVVVGVDPRWLLRSLSSHYDEILAYDGGVTDTWQVMPEDYLEKILNLPVVLPRMSSGSLRQLLRSMVEDGVEAPAHAPTTAEGNDADPTMAAVDSVRRLTQEPVDPNTMTVEAGSEVDTQHSSAQPPRIPLPLTNDEIDLLGALELLVDTPREAKRLVNLYRMLRATRDLSKASRFLGKDGKPGDYQAVVVLLGLLTAHARLLGRVLDTPPDPVNGVLGGLVHRPETTNWSSFVNDFEPEKSEGAWTNRIVGLLPDDEVRHWVRLHRRLTQLSGKVTLANLANFQLWVPRIRRFSYVLSPPTGS